jgi:lipopolysaccharide biosynthesis regulator YciM
MPELSPLTWTVGIAALVIGILAGHFGWGRHWRIPRATLHPDYLAGLDYLVTEQPDRALDVFLKLMDTNTDTVETHFSLGALYRRRGEVERAIRIHQNLLARDGLAEEHREQALLALAQDFLRAGLLDRAEGLLLKVSEVPRLRVTALDSLRGVYERQHEWQQALDAYRSLARIQAAPPGLVAAHYLCELAAAAIDCGDADGARRLLREARAEVSPFPRAAVLRAQIAEQAGDRDRAVRLLRHALAEAPQLMQEELPHLLRLVDASSQSALLADLVAQASHEPNALKRFVFSAILAGQAESAPLRAAIVRVLADDPTLRAFETSSPDDLGRVVHEIGALLANAEKYRCRECGFAGRHFYWHCPACHAWDSFESYAIVKLG